MKGCGEKFPAHIRQQIRSDYKGLCQECKIRAGIQVHHIVKLNDGGQGVFTNGILFCEEWTLSQIR